MNTLRLMALFLIVLYAESCDDTPTHWVAPSIDPCAQKGTYCSLDSAFAHRETVRSIILIGKGYDSIPAGLSVFPSLVNFEMNSADLTQITPEIAEARKLTSLGIYSSGVDSLCPEISELQELYRLDLRDNKLRWLPSEICMLTKLHYMVLSGNQLTSLPDSMDKMLSLTAVFLDRNRFTKEYLDTLQKKLPKVIIYR
jgi:Leucine-rich repeat (LRR) protein